MDMWASSKQTRSKRAIEVRPRQPRKSETSPRKPRAQEITPQRITPRKILPKPGFVRMANLRRNQKKNAATIYSQSEVDICTWAPGRYLL